MMELKWTKFSDCHYPKGEPGDTMIVHCEDTDGYMVVVYGHDTFWRNAQTGEKELDMHGYMTAWAKIKPYKKSLKRLYYTSHNMATWFDANKYIPDNGRNVLTYVKGHIPTISYYSAHSWHTAGGTAIVQGVDYWQYIRSTMELHSA